MSGGHWEYVGSRIKDGLSEIASDIQVKERFPTLSLVLLSLANDIECIEHDLDYDISGDEIIESDLDFEMEALIHLHQDVDFQEIVKHLEERERQLGDYINQIQSLIENNEENK